MTWTINPDPVCGGISIIDENGRGVAIVIQRDPHPTLGQGVTLEEAERRAALMAASEDLLEALDITSEAAGILRLLIESIEECGNFSPDSMINFLNQALGCHYKSAAAIARARGEA